MSDSISRTCGGSLRQFWSNAIVQEIFLNHHPAKAIVIQRSRSHNTNAGNNITMTNSAGFDLDLSVHDDQRSFKTVSTLTLDLSTHPKSKMSPVKKEKLIDEVSAIIKTRNHCRTTTPSSPQRKRGRSREQSRKETIYSVSDGGDGKSNVALGDSSHSSEQQQQKYRIYVRLKM